MRMQIIIGLMFLLTACGGYERPDPVEPGPRPEPGPVIPPPPPPPPPPVPTTLEATPDTLIFATFQSYRDFFRDTLQSRPAQTSRHGPVVHGPNPRQTPALIRVAVIDQYGDTISLGAGLHPSFRSSKPSVATAYGWNGEGGPRIWGWGEAQIVGVYGDLTSNPVTIIMHRYIEGSLPYHRTYTPRIGGSYPMLDVVVGDTLRIDLADHFRDPDGKPIPWEMFEVHEHDWAPWSIHQVLHPIEMKGSVLELRGKEGWEGYKTRIWLRGCDNLTCIGVAGVYINVKAP